MKKISIEDFESFLEVSKALGIKHINLKPVEFAEIPPTTEPTPVPDSPPKSSFSESVDILPVLDFDFEEYEKNEFARLANINKS